VNVSRLLSLLMGTANTEKTIGKLTC